MGTAGLLAEDVEKRWVHREHVSRWRLDVHHELRRIGVKRSGTGRDAFCFGQIDGLRRLFRMTESRAIEEHLSLLPPRQVGEPLGTVRAFEGEESIAVDPGEPEVRHLQHLTAHALDRIAPEAVDSPYDAHVESPFPRAIVPGWFMVVNSMQPQA
jgi:hypothetical protein